MFHSRGRGNSGDGPQVAKVNQSRDYSLLTKRVAGDCLDSRVESVGPHVKSVVVM